MLQVGVVEYLSDVELRRALLSQMRCQGIPKTACVEMEKFSGVR
jgi:hypothetical protein